MANPFEDSDEFSVIKENITKQGFLCPECKTQFNDKVDLEKHYSSFHLNEQRNINNNVQTQLILTNQFNKFIGKAKKILKTEVKNDEVEPKNDLKEINFFTNKNESENYYLLRKDQEIGYLKENFILFKSIRNFKIEHYIYETNKLLIRLDQLLQDLPSDPEKRKNHEMAVVDWANDDDVKLCPFCAKSFYLSRRRHHCRLCGAIMCYDCSHFFDIDYAKKLINPVDLDASNLNNILTVKEFSQESLKNSKNNFKKGNASPLSLLGINLINYKDNEYLIKVCKDCKSLCDRRIQQIIDKHTRPMLLNFYEKMVEYQIECDKLIPLYIKMCDSLYLGESIFQLHDARELRIKIMKLGDTMDFLSKKILSSENELEVYIPLKNKLRLSVLQYLKNNFLGLPSLPREEEVKELQEKKHNQIKLDLQNNENSNNEVNSPKINTPYKNSVNNMNKKQEETVLIDNGWGLDDLNINEQDNNMDPLELQIQIIKKYIEQARKDHKYEEVNLLENNLKQLEIENYLQKNNKDLQ